MSQSGRYIASLYDDEWYIAIIMYRCNENNVTVKFIRQGRLCLSWYEHGNQCWVPFQHILCTVKSVRKGRQYSLKKE